MKKTKLSTKSNILVKSVYDHLKIEKKWQSIWNKKKVYKTSEKSNEKKCYVLDMFPYPSGEGLHVGHPRGYIATDIYSRFKRMNGFNVLHPMGWDAFGLPAEQYAIKMKINPEIAVKKNIKRYKKQISAIGLNYDWSREINTTDPKYYKWTQWIFLQLFKKGLAYESYEPINWCPSCKTGLANEDVEGGKCERCGTKVIKKPMRQWVLKIRDYADRLVDDLNELNWPEHIKELQRNWIGRSEGAKLWFNIANSDDKIFVFTTRPDTLYGVTYVVLAPENKLVEKLKPQIKNWKDVEDYIKKAKNKTEIERTSATKEKTGVELKGIIVKHPLTKEIIPVFISDYVLAHYGTGAVMAVPAHDERDFIFARKYNLPVKQVIVGGNAKHSAYTGSGKIINSGIFDGMNNEEAKKKIAEYAGGEMTKTYKLQDWVFSRQRYWGEPIPLIHCEKCGVVPVPEKDLPVKLPKVKSYESTDNGESPLAIISKWVNVKCPTCGAKAKRETNTMPQWAGSSWYYLRYMDPKNNKALVDKNKEKYWAPVDMYVGGAEHATRHLIYARFWHKFLFDIGVVSTKEPFKQLKNQGMVLGSDNRKMSKRWGNVVNPDEVIKNVGADTLRVYESFMGPFEQEIAWSTNSMVGSKRFLEKVWKLQDKVSDKFTDSDETVLLFNQTIKKVGGDIESFNANTAISSMMIFSNHLESEQKISRKIYLDFVKILSPFAPHICEEIWKNLGNKKMIISEAWPKYDGSKIISSKAKVVVQINGKFKATIEVPLDSLQDVVEKEARKNEAVVKLLADKKILKVIFVKNKIINFVI